jgi:hypothetical protein
MESQTETPNRARRRTVTLVAMCAIAGGAFLLGRSVPKPAACVCTAPDRIVAYYFHRTERCPTCQQVEALAREAIESAFAGQLKDGRLQWLPVNYQASGNEHYRSDYKIDAPCLVLARIRNGKPVEWRSLPAVWKHVGDKPACVRLVQENVREFLGYIAVSGACCT